VHTFYLHNARQQNDANELYTAIRQLLPPEAKSFFVPSQMAIEICAPAEQVALVQKLVNDLDHPKKNYRLTYTVTEMDGAKRVNVQHFSMVVAPGQQTVLKEGSRVPVATGSFGNSGTTTQTQFTYIDIGMNFNSTVQEVQDGVILLTSVDRSSVAEEKSAVGPQDPVVRQATFKGTVSLSAGKAIKLGSLDMADSTRHLELEVMMELL
jgi:type II secretory pathway component GspD/PulD (secretin)